MFPHMAVVAVAWQMRFLSPNSEKKKYCLKVTKTNMNAVVLIERLVCNNQHKKSAFILSRKTCQLTSQMYSPFNLIQYLVIEEGLYFDNQCQITSRPGEHFSLDDRELKLK